ncbi:MAG: DUF3703 domain-containing protein [Ilumatobacteraceae bacterium]
MSPEIKQRLAANLASVGQLRNASETTERWRLLEEAHILSQPWAVPHIKVHGAMLIEAVRARDRREALGQVVRLVVAGPGSLTGRYPVGNTGRATVDMTLQMPVPAHLEALLATKPSPSLEPGAP